MKFLMQLVWMLLSTMYFETIKISTKIGREIKTKYHEMYYKNTCAVCQEKLTNTFQTHCHHQFHHTCLLTWFVANMQTLPVEFVQEQVIKSPDEEVVYICPLCRGSLRSDYYNNMICKPNGYQYSEKFKGDQLGNPFPVTTPKNCAQACDTEPLCYAYTMGYEYSEMERPPIRETICRLFQPSSRNDQTKKKNKEKQNTAKHAIHNVCRKQTDQETGLSQHLPTLGISPKSRLYKINETVKAFLELVKAFSLFFISAINQLWTYIKTYRPQITAIYFIELLFQPILPKKIRLILIPLVLMISTGYELDVQTQIHLERALINPSTRKQFLSYERSRPNGALLPCMVASLQMIVIVSILRKVRINTFYTKLIQKILAMYFTYIVVILILHEELFSSNSGLFLVLVYIGHLYDLAI